jgi:hypothetical protein
MRKMPQNQIVLCRPRRGLPGLCCIAYPQLALWATDMSSASPTGCRCLPFVLLCGICVICGYKNYVH